MYLTATSIGLQFPRSRREHLWAQVPLEHALVLLASMLADADTNGQLAGGRRDIDGEWASRIKDETLRVKVQLGLTLRNVIIVPQLLVLAIREALQQCPPGPPRGDWEHTDLLIACLLGIGDDEHAVQDKPGVRWAGLEARLAADLVSNIYFNRAIALHHLMATTESTWTMPWPTLAPEADRAAVGGEPAELFLEATDVTPEVMQQVTVQLYVNYLETRALVFPTEFFYRTGVDPEQLQKVLALICADITALADSLGQRTSGWEFNPLRRTPLLRLGDGRILILRLGWLMERVLSDVTYFDIREHLKEIDLAKGSHRDRAFRRCVQAKLEADTGAALRRIFAHRGGHIWHEVELQGAWDKYYPKSRPQMCDYVVRVGHYWLLIDATDRAIPTDVVAGVSGVSGLDLELDRVLTGRKAKQLDSTVNLLRRHMDDLTGKPTDPDAVFIPIVATPQAGLPWMHIVGVEATAKLSKRGLLQAPDILPAALMNPKDFSLLERQAESRGVSAIESLVEWRCGQWANWGFDAHLHQTGLRLDATVRERRAAARILQHVARLSESNIASRRT